MLPPVLLSSYRTAISSTSIRNSSGIINRGWYRYRDHDAISKRCRSDNIFRMTTTANRTSRRGYSSKLSSTIPFARAFKNSRPSNTMNKTSLLSSTAMIRTVTPPLMTTTASSSSTLLSIWSNNKRYTSPCISSFLCLWNQPQQLYQQRSMHHQSHRLHQHHDMKMLPPHKNSILSSFSSSPFQYKLCHRHDSLTSSYLNNNIGALATFSSRSGGGGGGSRLASGIGIIGAATVLFGKTKYVLAALKVTKLASLGSMVFTIGTYTMFFGFPYAVGMVGLILVHEMGHAAVMHYKNVPFTPMVFIPFMGAVIAMKEYPRDAWDDAMIAIGGPVAGSLGAGVVALGAHMTQSQLLYALADFGFMINLFNLLPIGSMDGGRIAGALSKWVGVGGIGFGSYLAYSGVIHNPLFYLILLSSGYETFQRFYDPHHLPPNYYKISSTQRVALTASYLGLITSLLIAMDVNQRYRKPPEVLIHERQMLEKSWDFR